MNRVMRKIWLFVSWVNKLSFDTKEVTLWQLNETAEFVFFEKWNASLSHRQLPLFRRLLRHLATISRGGHCCLVCKCCCRVKLRCLRFVWSSLWGGKLLFAGRVARVTLFTGKKIKKILSSHSFLGVKWKLMNSANFCQMLQNLLLNRFCPVKGAPG